MPVRMLFLATLPTSSASNMGRRELRRSMRLGAWSATIKAVSLHLVPWGGKLQGGPMPVDYADGASRDVCPRPVSSCLQWMASRYTALCRPTPGSRLHSRHGDRMVNIPLTDISGTQQSKTPMVEKRLWPRRKSEAGYESPPPTCTCEHTRRWTRAPHRLLRGRLEPVNIDTHPFNPPLGCIVAMTMDVKA
jgi:hypothetical protein